MQEKESGQGVGGGERRKTLRYQGDQGAEKKNGTRDVERNNQKQIQKENSDRQHQTKKNQGQGLTQEKGINNEMNEVNGQANIPRFSRVEEQGGSSSRENNEGKSHGGPKDF